MGVQYYFSKNMKGDDKEVVQEKKKMDDKPKSREEYEEVLKNTISPGRPSVCDMPPEKKVERHEWSMIPDTVLSEVLNKLDQTAVKYPFSILNLKYHKNIKMS